MILIGLRSTNYTQSTRKKLGISTTPQPGGLYDRIIICTYQDQKFGKTVEKNNTLCGFVLSVVKLFGQQKKTLEYITIVVYANETTNSSLYHHSRFGSSGMAFLDNLESSMADDDGMPSQKDINAIKELLKDPHLEERLKYMEDNGIQVWYNKTMTFINKNLSENPNLKGLTVKCHYCDKDSLYTQPHETKIIDVCKKHFSMDLSS